MLCLLEVYTKNPLAHLLLYHHIWPLGLLYKKDSTAFIITAF